MTKPFYANIDWEVLRKWDQFAFSRDQIGIGDSGINLVIKYGRKHGAEIEYIEYDDRVVFYIASRRESTLVSPAKIKEIYNFIYEGKGSDSVYLRENCGLTRVDLSHCLSFLMDNDYITAHKVKGARGRPSTRYEINEDNPYEG